jgi:LPS-assembly protein
VLATEEISPFPFLDGPRNYSPVSSTLTVNPYTFFGIDWRSDYDPLRHSFVDQTVAANFTHKKFGFHVSDAIINTNPVLVPHANQVNIGGSYGSANRKGWNVSAITVYDLILERRLIDFVTASYNTDCCGFSFQLRNFNLGLRDDNQYLFSFSLANIGTFGSLPKQARTF